MRKVGIVLGLYMGTVLHHQDEAEVTAKTPRRF